MAGLLVIILFPRLSSFTVEAEVAELRAEAEKAGTMPYQAWALECIQEDPPNYVPCTPEDIEKYGEDGKKMLAMPVGGDEDDEEIDFDDEGGDDDELMDEFMDGEGGGSADTPDTEEELLDEFMDEGDDSADEEKKEEESIEDKSVDELADEF